MKRDRVRHMLLAALLAAVPATVLAQGTITHDCSSGGAVSSGGGWQAPGVTPVSGDSTCGPGETTFLWASFDSYWRWLRLAPDFAEMSVETEVVLLDRDGMPDDAFSLLLHWNGSTDPSACCAPVHASAGLRVLFSMERSRMEIYQESGGVTAGPLATLPFMLPIGTPRAIKVTYSGTLLELAVDGVPIGAVAVPATPPSLFGFDARGISVRFGPFLLTTGCAGDADCDGVGDGTDNCPGVQGADQTDTDGDGLGNLCDIDDDGDGLVDTSDRCPLVPDPLQADADLDWIGDACDACPSDPYNDADGDLICGQGDNCPTIPNPWQENQDGDSAGDLCDFDDGDFRVLWSDQSTLTFQRETLYDAFHVYRRNVMDLRATGAYVLDPASQPGPLDRRTCDLPFGFVWNDVVPPGEAVVYFISGSMEGVEGTLGTDSSGAERPNPHPCGPGPRIELPHPFERILYEETGGPTSPLMLLIDDIAEWCAALPSHCSDAPIDFATHVAIVVSDGVKPDSCHEIKVTDIRSSYASETDVVVEYDVIRILPPEPCACLTVMIEPLEVVKTPRPVTSATFIQRPRTVIPPCP